MVTKEGHNVEFFLTKKQKDKETEINDNGTIETGNMNRNELDNIIGKRDT